MQKVCQGAHMNFLARQWTWKDSLLCMRCHRSQLCRGSEGSGPNIFPLSMQAQASAGDDGQPYFLDIFCGTAGVTAALKRYGAEAIGIDHVIDKRRMKGPAVKLDLTKKSSQKLVLDEIRSGRVKGVMLAPPCGTSSRGKKHPTTHCTWQAQTGAAPLEIHGLPGGAPGSNRGESNSCATGQQAL